MDKNGAKDVKSESQDEHKEKRDKPENGNHVQPSKSPKKRRKVNHGTSAGLHTSCDRLAVCCSPSCPLCRLPRSRDYTS